MNSLLWVLLFLSALAACSSLWENPQGGRKPRQRLGGIFHTLRSGLWRSLVFAAAWWYERVVNPFSASAFDWFYVPIRSRFGHRHAWRIATFVEMHLLPFLLGDWLVWPIARVYLQTKWQAELDEQNRNYHVSHGGEK